MRKLMMVLALIFSAGCSSSGGPAGPIIDVESARARWTVEGFESYRYDLERICFCVPEAREPVTIEVRNGVVTAVASRNTWASMLGSEVVAWPTIEELFEMIERAEADGERVSVEFAPSGYPSVIEIGELAADAGTNYLISNAADLD